MTPETNAQEFETQACTRCGGSGHYSYCSTYGTTCFKCAGRRVIYTKRGATALAHMRELRTVRAADVTPGWLLWVEAPAMPGMGTYKAGWYAVESVSGDGSKYCVKVDGVETWHPCLMLNTSVMSYGLTPDSKVQAVPNREKLAETRAAALAYQSSLTKRGTVRRGGAAIAAEVRP